MQEGYEMAIVWEAVGRMMQYRPLREARRAGKILMYVQAVDRPTCDVPAAEYREMLERVSLSDTGKLMGLLPLFIGMRVRLTMKLSAKYTIVPDAVGEVCGIQYNPREFAMHGSDTRIGGQIMRMSRTSRVMSACSTRHWVCM